MPERENDPDYRAQEALDRARAAVDHRGGQYDPREATAHAMIAQAEATLALYGVLIDVRNAVRDVGRK